MARKRNEEYIGEDDDGEFEEEPVDSYEDPPDFVDDISDEGKSHEFKIVEGFVSRSAKAAVKSEYVLCKRGLGAHAKYISVRKIAKVVP